MVISFFRNLLGGPLGRDCDLKAYFESHEIIFKCTKRGESDISNDFEVFGFFNDGLEAEGFPEWSNDELNAVYEKYDGFHVYTPAREVGDGFRLFRASEVKNQQRDFLDSIADCREEFREESTFSHLDAWIDGLLPIAEPVSSGDYYALDTYEYDKSGKPLIHRLDHELFWGGCFSPDLIEESYDGINKLLSDLIGDPIYHVGSHWTGGDYNDQWYPNSVLVSSR